MVGEVELLVFARDSDAAARFARDLGDLGFRVDCTTTESEAQSRFLARGGHRWLVIAPDVGSGPARSLIHKLRSVDADLAVILFGDDLLRDATMAGVHRIRSFHPGSRAGLGALQRLVGATPR